MIGQRFPVFIDFHAGPELAVTLSVTWCVNAFRADGFKTGTEQLRGFSIPDRLDEHFTVESMNTHPFPDKLSKSALSFNVYFTKNRITVFGPGTFHFIHKAFCRGFPHPEIPPVRAVTDEEKVTDDMILVQGNGIRRNTIVTNQIVGTRVTQSQ